MPCARQRPWVDKYVSSFFFSIASQLKSKQVVARLASRHADHPTRRSALIGLDMLDKRTTQTCILRRTSSAGRDSRPPLTHTLASRLGSISWDAVVRVRVEGQHGVLHVADRDARSRCRHPQRAGTAQKLVVHTKYSAEYRTPTLCVFAFGGQNNVFTLVAT